MDKRTDVVIVGGGIVGLCTAHALVERGITNIRIVESAHVAAGSTGLALGVIRRWHSDPVWTQLAAESWDFFTRWEHAPGPQLLDDIRIEVITPAGDGKPRQADRPEATRLGTPYQVLAGERVVESPARRAQPVKLAAEIAKWLAGRGIAVDEGVTATEVLVRDGVVRGVATDSGEIECGTCVLACGPRLDLLDPLFRAPIQLAQMPTATFTGCRYPDAPLLLDFAGSVYIAPEDIHWIVSRPPFAEPVAEGEAGPDLVRAARELAAALRRRVPDTTTAIRGVTVGTCDLTPDERPLVGAVPGAAGCLVAVGLAGSGFQVAPAVGARLASQAAGAQPDRWDARLAPGRFA